MKARLYSGLAGTLPGMSSLSVGPRPVLSRVRHDEGALDLSGFSAAEAAVILHRHGVLMMVRRLVKKGLTQDQAIEEAGESRSTYFVWARAFRRSHGNPRALLPKSRARKTPPEKAAWTPHVEHFVMLARNEFMVNAKDLAYCYALSHPRAASVSWRTMARIIAHLVERGLICPAERGKKPLKNGKKRVCEMVWSTRLAGRRDLRETGHFEIDHMVVTGAKKCCNARVFVARDKVDGRVFPRAFASATSEDARAFIGWLRAQPGGEVKSMQSDNGSEFKKGFESALKEKDIPHLLIPAASPTWNNMVENANNMLRIRCINFGLDYVETIEELNGKLAQAAFVYNHTPKDFLPLAPAELKVPAGSHLTPYQLNRLMNGQTPGIIPFGACKMES